MYTGTNNIKHATKHKNLLFKNNNSNHDNTKTDKEKAIVKTWKRQL